MIRLPILIGGLMLMFAQPVSADQWKDESGHRHSQNKEWKENRFKSQEKRWDAEERFREKEQKRAEKAWERRRKAEEKYLEEREKQLQRERRRSAARWGSYRGDRYPTERRYYVPDHYPPLLYPPRPLFYDSEWNDRGAGGYRTFGDNRYYRPPYANDARRYHYSYPSRGADIGARIGARIGGALGGAEGAAIGADIGRDIGIDLDR